MSANDPVNRPSHYTDGKIEVIDFIEDKKLGFHLGNTVKYVARAGKKDPAKLVEDLKKARWYLDRYIQLHSPATTTELEYGVYTRCLSCGESFPGEVLPVHDCK